MSDSKVILQSHHVIEKIQFSNSELLKILVDEGVLDVNASRNRLYLPVDGELADQIESTPHRGRTRSSYNDGLSVAIRRLEAGIDDLDGLRENPAELSRIAKKVEALQDTLKVAMINGDAFPTTPDRLTKDGANAANRETFRDLDGYAVRHADQIDNLRRMGPVESEWAAVTHNEKRVAFVVEAAQLEGRHLVAGPDELPAREVAGRMEMRMAVAQAQESQRLTLSEETSKIVKQVLVDELPEIGSAKGGVYDLASHPPKTYVPLSQRGGISPELLFGNPTANGALRAAGLFASAADTVATTRRMGQLYDQDNLLAAQSEAVHFAGRNVGGWAGGTMTAYALGASAGAGPMALIAADAAFWSMVGEKAADMWDEKKIYQQKDASGVEWEFTGRAWTRPGMADTTSDGVDNPASMPIAASYEAARALNCKATNASVDLALKALPSPQNPYRQPASNADTGSISPADWIRDPADGEWHRTVKVGVSGEGNRGIYVPETASPARAAELDAQAESTIARNIANSPAAVAARYDAVYHRSGWGTDNLERSKAADFAMGDADKLSTWDGQKYERVGEGQWVRDGVPATGNALLELENTRSLLLPELARHETLIEEIKAHPPSHADIAREQTQYRYRMIGTELFTGWQHAIDEAVQRTREEHGLSGGAMQLQPDSQGNLSAASPVAHLQVGEDGVRRVVALTTSEEILQALRDANAAPQADGEVRQAPELKISALTPQQAEAHEQALREANRAGLSKEQAGQAAMLAAQMQGRDSGEYSDAIDFAAAPSLEERGVAGDRGGDEAAVAEAARIADAAAAATQAATRPAGLDESTTPSPPSTAPDHARQQSEQRERDATRAEQEATRVEQETTRTEHDRATQAQVDANERAEVPPPTSAHALAQPTEHPASNEVPEVAVQPSVAASQTENAHAALPEVTADQPVQPTTPGIPQAELPAERYSEQAIQGAEPAPERDAELAHVDANMERELPPPGHEAQTEEALSAPGTPFRDEVPEQVASAPDLVPADEPAITGLEPSDPAHPAHALYRQVREQVEKLDESLGRNYDATSERLTDSLMVLAKENGLERVDHVVLSNQAGDKPPGYNVFVVQGELDNPAHRRVSMPTEQAVQTPHEESMARLDELLQHDAEQEQQVTQQRQQEHDTMQQEIQFAAMHMGGGGGGGG